MTTEELEAGKVLDGVINYYTAILADLADDAKKEAALYALLSSGNPEVAAGGDSAYIGGLRNGVIADIITEINARKTTKETEFAALATEPVG
jgi:hypothetical protein